MHDQAIYSQLITIIVQAKLRTLGAAATAQANAVRGLQVDSSGAVVSLPADPVAATEELLARYEKLTGSASTALLLVRLTALLGKHPSLVLPPRLEAARAEAES
jgi:hypothetical protein